MKLGNGQETRKRWQGKKSWVHTLRPFLAAPLTGMLGVSWHWQAGISSCQLIQGLNKAPLSGVAFSHYEAPQNLRAGLITCFIHGMSFTQSHHRVSKVQQKLCILRKQRLELWVLLPCPEDPRRAPKMIAYGECCWICDLRRRRFNFGTRDQAWSHKSFCVAEFY